MTIIFFIKGKERLLKILPGCRPAALSREYIASTIPYVKKYPTLPSGFEYRSTKKGIFAVKTTFV